MEKMNQVSVSEFFAKSKEEMYDDAVAMVEKYNRLIDRHAVYTNALNEDIANKASKINLLEKEIEGRKEGYTALKELMDTKYISIYEHNDICKTYENKVAELKKESEKWQDLAKMNRDTICNQYDVCEDFKKKIAEIEEENEKLKVDLIHEREKNEKLAKDHAELENDVRKYAADIKTLEEKVKRQRDNLEGINKTLDIRTKENESLVKVRNNLKREIEAHEEENARLTEKIMELKKERDKHMARVNDLRMELDCVKASKEKHEEAAHDKVVEGLRETITYWRNKYVAAQEEIEKLKDEKANKEDDHGRKGFEEYIKYIISEEEGKFKAELDKRLSEEVSKISQKRTEEELAKVKLNDKFGVGGIVNEFKGDIPCGEDSIE